LQPASDHEEPGVLPVSGRLRLRDLQRPFARWTISHFRLPEATRPDCAPDGPRPRRWSEEQPRRASSQGPSECTHHL